MANSDEFFGRTLHVYSPKPSSVTNQQQHPIAPPPEPSVGPARCPGSGSYEDGKWHWREGCDDCQRRIPWGGEGWIDPPPIIAFECEYRIGPDEIVAQGEHAPVPEPLSPDAMAVLDAFLNGYICNSADNSVAFQADRNGLAAALRELADQVVPERLLCTRTAEERTLYHEGRLDAAIRFRAEILAIATELEALK